MGLITLYSFGRWFMCVHVCVEERQRKGKRRRGRESLSKHPQSILTTILGIHTHKLWNNFTNYSYLNDKYEANYTYASASERVRPK